jgi:hypothetical protein
VLVSWLDVATDVAYLALVPMPPSIQGAVLAFIVLQPILYYIYYIAMMALYLAFDPESGNYRRDGFLAMVFLAPLYSIFGEFKLLLTPIYKIIIPTFI